MAKFEIYRSGSEYRWRLKAANGETVASGEGYVSKQGAKDAVEWVKTHASGAGTDDQA